MDIATLVGIIISGALIFISILTGQGVAFFFSLSSALIVIGGTIGSTLVSYPLAEVMAVMNVARNAFLQKSQSSSQTIEMLVRVAEKARREGILAIEKEIDDLDDNFVKIGVQYAVDGTEPETIRAIMESELSSMENRHNLGKRSSRQWGPWRRHSG